MYCTVRSMMLFSQGEWTWCSTLRNLHACGYHVPPSVESGCSPCSSKNPDRKHSTTTNMFLSWIFLLREFPCWQAPQLPPIKAIQTLNQFQIMSRQLQNPQPSFSLRKASLVCAFVSSSGWKHGFVW